MFVSTNVEDINEHIEYNLEMSMKAAQKQPSLDESDIYEGFD